MFSAKERAFAYLEQEKDYDIILYKLLGYIPDREFYGNDIKQGKLKLYQEDIKALSVDVRTKPDAFNTQLLLTSIRQYEEELRRLVSVKKALFLLEILLQSERMQFLTIKHLVNKYHLQKVLIKAYLR